MRFRAHFDGRVIVPDEPVHLAVNQPLTVETAAPQSLPDKTTDDPDAGAIAAYRHLMSRPVHGPVISDESLRRENLYDDHRNRL